MQQWLYSVLCHSLLNSVYGHVIELHFSVTIRNLFFSVTKGIYLSLFLHLIVIFSAEDKSCFCEGEKGQIFYK